MCHCSDPGTHIAFGVGGGRVEKLAGRRERFTWYMKRMFRERFAGNRKTTFSVDASACRRMLVRTSMGSVKDLGAKQVSMQGAMQSSGTEVLKVYRAGHPFF